MLVVSLSDGALQSCIEVRFIRIERPFDRVEWLKTYPRGILKWQRLLQQFAQIPLNLLPENGKADYIDTGIWSQKAIEEG